MAVEIAEIRAHQRDEAVAFAREHAAAVDAARLRLSTSVIARDGDRIVGAVLCTHHAGGGCELGVGVAKDGAGDLGRVLVDKALMKLQSAGARMCRITARDGSPWHGPNWLAEQLEPQMHTDSHG